MKGPSCLEREEMWGKFGFIFVNGLWEFEFDFAKSFIAKSTHERTEQHRKKTQRIRKAFNNQKQSSPRNSKDIFLQFTLIAIILTSWSLWRGDSKVVRKVKSVYSNVFSQTHLLCCDSEWVHGSVFP